MDTLSRLNSLRESTAELLNTALDKIRRARANSRGGMQARFRIAEYLLNQARQYTEASWDLLKAEKPEASLAVSRWVLEAALDLLWAIAESTETEDRIKFLASEGLRLEALRLEALPDWDPNQAAEYRESAADARSERDRLGNLHRKYSRSLEVRIISLRKQLEAKSIANPYTLYRLCCGASHPAIDLWRMFSLGPGGATVTRDAPHDVEQNALARYISAVAALHLVSGAYCLTNVGDSKDLKAWWEDQVVPLL